MSSEAISAAALGGEGDHIAVAATPREVFATAPATTVATMTNPTSDLPVPSDASALSSNTSTGLRSPPDSNNAFKPDGGSSDSELSDLDDDALNEAFGCMPSDEADPDADAAVTSVTTPTTAGPDSAPASSASDASMKDDCPASASSLPKSGPPPSAAADADADAEDLGEIEPDHYTSGSVPVFRPTMHQFQDFKKFMEKIDKYGMKSGIVKIIPPQEWKDSLAPLDELVKPIKVREPIKQDIMGSNGTYRQVNILHQRTYNLPQWRQLCDQSEHQPPARRGERRANADKPKPAARARAAAAASTAAPVSASSPASTAAAGKRPKRGRGGRRATRQHPAVADDDTASVVSEPQPMTPESQRGDDERTVMDDDKTCVDSDDDSLTTRVGDKVEDEIAVVSVEADRPIKMEEDTDAEEDDVCVRAPAAPRRMGFARQGTGGKTQSTSARRKHYKREGSAKVDEAAFKDWDYRMDVSDYTEERCEELERIYWKTLTYAPPLYGADLPGTLFDESTKLWNLNKLPNLLDVLGTKVPGVNTAYLYLGMWKATFAWHLEDVDLYSINYLHFGAPKQWYSISQGDARRFEAAMKNIWPTDAKACDQFLRHKAFLISPSHLLSHYNIRVNKCVSYPGEFVVTYPYGYHSGYNLGYNCAEAVNFALESWLPMGKIAKKCECAEAQDSVWVDVYEIERKLRGISTDDEEEDFEDEEEEFDEDVDDAEDDQESGSLAGHPRPPAGGRSVRIQPTRTRVTGKRKRPTKPHGRGSRKLGADAGVDDDDVEERGAGRKVKKIRLRLYSGEGAPCCLCPNDFPDTELLPTDDGRKAHRLCAMYIPETDIETIDGQDMVTHVADIPLSRLELRCMNCRLRKGVCLQCSVNRCSRAYHPTCAAAAGAFVEEAFVPVYGDDGTEYKDHVYEFTCRFQRTKRDRKLNSDALEKNERIRSAAAALQEGAVCQMQLFRSDIFAGVVVENRVDEEMLLLHVIPSGDKVEVEWKWLLLPDPTDYRLPQASANALPLPRSMRAKEVSNVSKRTQPFRDDVFVEGYTWKEFQSCGSTSFAQNTDQAPVDLSKSDQLWHYLGSLSTESKAQYTEDPSRAVHNPKSNFLDSVPKPPPSLAMPPPMQPPKRTVAKAQRISTPAQSKNVDVVLLPPQEQQMLPRFSGQPENLFVGVVAGGSFAAPSAGPSAGQQPGAQTVGQPEGQPVGQPVNEPTGQPAAQSGVQSSAQLQAEPRRSYSAINPPYVPHTSPTTAPAPVPQKVPSLPGSEAVDQPRKPSDSFAPPKRPAPKHTPAGFHRHQPGSSSQSAPFGSHFSMPNNGAFDNKFPQIQHPNLTHGYATVPMTAKPRSMSMNAVDSTVSPPSGSTTTSIGSRRNSILPPPPKTAAASTGAARKFPFFQAHCNRDANTYRSPYVSNGGSSVGAGAAQDGGSSGNSKANNASATNHSISSSSSNSALRAHLNRRRSSSGAAALAQAAAKLHKRSASSISSASSFSMGNGLTGLTRPKPYTNYVGPPPVPSSTVSSPYLSTTTLPFGPRPGSSVSSYASYDFDANGNPHMSPHSPPPLDASPFVGSPGPQMSAFDFQPSGSGSGGYSQHPGMRPQFGPSWQQSFNAPLGSYGQDMDMNFSPPSPMSTAMGLGPPANIQSGHQSHRASFSYAGSPTALTGGSPLLTGGSMSGYEAMSPPLFAESPLLMSPTLEATTPQDTGTDLSPEEQLKQQLRSISDSSLPSSYRLRCLHQPRRRHQSRSSLNRIYTSQLLDLNPT